MINIVLLIFLVASSSSSVFCTTQLQSSAPKPEPPLASNGASTRTTLPMLIVIFIISLFITAFCSVYVRYCSYQDQDLLPQTTHEVARGIDPRVLATCPVVSYSALKPTGLGIKKAPQNAAFRCAVCLAEFEDSDNALRLLPRCGHVFHRSCIDAWLAAHVTCPVCRGEVSVENEGDRDTRARHVFEESSSAKGFGVLLRSHSTGHSLESFTLRFPEEVMMMKLLEESERGSVMTGMKRSASYDVVLRSVEGGEDSNSNSNGNGKSNNDNNRWVLSMMHPFVSRGSGIPRFWDTSVREEKECRGRNFQCEV